MLIEHRGERVFENEIQIYIWPNIENLSIISIASLSSQHIYN